MSRCNTTTPKSTATGAKPASCCAGAKSAAPGSSPIGQRVARWDELAPRALPIYAQFGPVVAAGVLGIGPERLVAFGEAMRQRGAKYLGRRIHKRSPEQTARAIREAAEWEDAGRPGVAAAVPASPAAAQAGRQVVVPAGVRITVAPPFVDRRFAPDPGHVGPFGLAGIGRDVQTGRAWA